MHLDRSSLNHDVPVAILAHINCGRSRSSTESNQAALTRTPTHCFSASAPRSSCQRNCQGRLGPHTALCATAEASLDCEWRANRWRHFKRNDWKVNNANKSNGIQLNNWIDKFLFNQCTFFQNSFAFRFVDQQGTHRRISVMAVLKLVWEGEQHLSQIKQTEASHHTIKQNA